MLSKSVLKKWSKIAGAVFLPPVMLGTLGCFLPHSCSSYQHDVDYQYEIYVKNNGAHTDIVLPIVSDAFDWRPFIPAHLHSYSWIAIGWGEEEFYLKTPTWADVTLPRIFRSLFLSEQSLMHFTLLRDVYLSQKVRKLNLSSKRLSKLSLDIRKWFVEPSADQIIPGYGRRDFFIKANGDYSPFYTCNTWTAERLRSINAPTPFWAGLPFAVTHHLD